MNLINILDSNCYSLTSKRLAVSCYSLTSDSTNLPGKPGDSKSTIKKHFFHMNLKEVGFQEVF